MIRDVKTQPRRLGLVLSGGGAKGAYQVGVLKCLAENHIQPHAVAGASIGALNAAVLASATSMTEGVERLEELWGALAATPPLEANLPGYLHLLLAGGMALASGPFSSVLARAAASAGATIAGLDRQAQGLLKSAPLYKLMEKYFSAEALATGLPLYVSVYKSSGGMRDLLAAATAELGIHNTKPSTFIHIQSLPPEQQRDMLLASAALPVLFSAGEKDGVRYTDGGLGGWYKSQGNTPVTPLLDAGITDIVVTHLSDGSLWNRHDFPQATMLEIRPRTSFERDGGHSDLLGFNVEKISSWMQQGYNDTQACIGRLADINTARHALRETEAILQAQQQAFSVQDDSLASAMARITRKD